VERGRIRRLREAGWSPRDAAAFLAASDPEAAVVEARRSLASALRRRRNARELTQMRLAALLGSSQSRVAKMEAADATVSLELLLRALVVLGATLGDVGRAVAERAAAATAAARRSRRTAPRIGRKR
jgi:DNA-binding XRE family transcriptional regulator